MKYKVVVLTDTRYKRDLAFSNIFDSVCTKESTTPSRQIVIHEPCNIKVVSEDFEVDIEFMTDEPKNTRGLKCDILVPLCYITQRDKHIITSWSSYEGAEIKEVNDLARFINNNGIWR